MTHLSIVAARAVLDLKSIVEPVVNLVSENLAAMIHQFE